MKQRILIFICIFCSLSAFSVNVEKEYKKLISKLDVAEEARSVSPNSPFMFWQTAIDNNEVFVKFTKDIQKNKGAEKEALQKTASLPRFYPQFDESIIESMQGFCDTLLIDMGIADLNQNCSLHIVYANEANTFTALTEDGFAMCLTSGLLDKKGISYNILMGYVAHEFTHGALMHHMRSFYAEAKRRRKNEIIGDIAVALNGIIAGLDASDAAAHDRPANDTDYDAVIDDIKNDIKLSTLEYWFEYSREQEYEADLIAYRFLENLGCADSYIDGLRILGTEYDRIYDAYYVSDECVGHPTISSRIDFLKFVKGHPELINKENRKLKKKRAGAKAK